MSNIKNLKDGCKINLDIPRTMTLSGLHYLAKLAQSVPENGIICEIGPLYGSSTWVLCNNSHPSVKVVSIDSWDESQKWVAKRLPEALPFSKTSFLKYTNDCENLTAIQGYSPDCIKESWNTQIDMFFDDATHGDPGFSENLNYFRNFMKPNSVFCGDDYASGWPDIIKKVNETAQEFNSTIDVMGRVWALNCGDLQDKIHGHPLNSVSDKLSKWSDINTNCVVKLKSGQVISSNNNMWCGKLLSEDYIVGIMLAAHGDITLNPEVITLSGKKIALKENIFYNFEEPIINLSLSPTGDAMKTNKISYQACEIYTPAVRKFKTVNSKAQESGFLEKAVDENNSLSAIRIETTFS